LKTSQAAKNAKQALPSHWLTIPTYYSSTNPLQAWTPTHAEPSGKSSAVSSQGKTIILTTHYLDEAQQLADHVAIMDHGRIVAIGTTAEIIQKHGSGERLEIQGTQKLADYIKANTN